ncbi:hypothetical protein D3C86_1407030 [compost metagenome]
MRDQTFTKVLGWLSIGNATALAFSVTQVLGKSGLSNSAWSSAIASSWLFLTGLIIAVFAMFFFSKAMNEFAQHAQLSLIAMRNEGAASRIDEIAQSSLATGKQDTKVVGWAAAISGGCFIIGAGVALLKVGAAAPLA